MSHYAALRTTSRRDTVLLQGRITLALSTWPYRLVGILTCVPATTPLVEDNVCEAPEEPTFKVALVFISPVRHRCRAHRRDSRRRSIMILLPVFTLCAWRLLCCRQLWRLQRFSFILVGGLCGCYCWYIALPAPAHSLERSAFGETARLLPAPHPRRRLWATTLEGSTAFTQPLQRLTWPHEEGPSAWQSAGRLSPRSCL